MIKRFLFASYAAVILFHASDVLSMIGGKNEANVEVYNSCNFDMSNSTTSSHLSMPLLNSDTLRDEEKEDNNETHYLMRNDNYNDDVIYHVFNAYLVNASDYGIYIGAKQNLIPLQPIDFSKRETVETEVNVSYEAMIGSPTCNAGDNIIDLDIIKPGREFSEDSSESSSGIGSSEKSHGIGSKIINNLLCKMLGTYDLNYNKNSLISRDSLFDNSNQLDQNNNNSPDRPDSRFYNSPEGN